MFDCVIVLTVGPCEHSLIQFKHFTEHVVRLIFVYMLALLIFYLY